MEGAAFIVRCNEGAFPKNKFGRAIALPKPLSQVCRSPLLFHPPLRQGGNLRLHSAFPWQNRGHDIRKPTRNPFLNLWVKAQALRTPQDNFSR